MEFKKLLFVEKLRKAKDFSKFKGISTEDALELGNYFNGFSTFSGGDINVQIYKTLMESGDTPDMIHKKWIMLRGAGLYAKVTDSQLINWYYNMLFKAERTEYEPNPAMVGYNIRYQVARLITANLIVTHKLYGFDQNILEKIFHLTTRVECELPERVILHIVDNKLFEYIKDSDSLVNATLHLWRKEHGISKEDMGIFRNIKGVPGRRLRYVIRKYTNARVDNLLVAKWVERNKNSAFLNNPIPVHGPGGIHTEMILMSRIDEIKPTDLTNGIKTSPKRAFENLEARLIKEKQSKVIFRKFPEPPWETPSGYIKLKNSDELVIEGQRMKHCVGTLMYQTACAEGRSVIYHYGDKAPNGVTVEIYWDSYNGTLVLGQAFAYHDTRVPNEIIDKIKSDFGIE